ncbi:MAG: hypothetical protein E6K79_10990 [Candidatus Eisenbacteria bacterium]|uniref:Glycerophosphoryl diester phosphodiesterase membrane domain-containing protein n=1 Tax=Eiseniibacteriota bacterium TaxID=2212470 RepID=A0A538THS8_UNCEI|nr:MAG: hypothetical protein E6K79_10990 [Candidatus Eisenbacteria bacterium]
MVLQGTAAPAGRSSLPPIDTYLRAVIALGFASLRRGLPALGFLYFYRLGMGLYLALSRDSSTPFGVYDERTLVLTAAMYIVAYLPMLVLITTPFLPLQDSILRGEPRSFGAAVRLVLERLVPLVISVITQAVLVVGPPALFFTGAALLLGALPSKPEELVRLLVLASLAPSFLYLIVILLFLLFTIPLVVLDGRGPFAGIRQSFGIVGRHFGGILGRLLVALLLLVIAGVAGSLPAGILDAVSAAASVDHPAFKIAGAIWEAAVSAFLFPFSVAALMVLYRAAVPARTGVADPDASGEPEGRPAANPYRFE